MLLFAVITAFAFAVPTNLHLSVRDPVPNVAKTLDDRYVLLKQYAPKIYLQSKEQYFPSSVSWAFDRTKRVFDKEWNLASGADLKNFKYDYPEFYGQKDLQNVPIYGYYVEKGEGVVDLVYYAYFPFNYGKKIPIAANTL